MPGPVSSWMGDHFVWLRLLWLIMDIFFLLTSMIYANHPHKLLSLSMTMYPQCMFFLACYSAACFCNYSKWAAEHRLFKTIRLCKLIDFHWCWCHVPADGVVRAFYGPTSFKWEVFCNDLMYGTCMRDCYSFASVLALASYCCFYPY